MKCECGNTLTNYERQQGKTKCRICRKEESVNNKIKEITEKLIEQDLYDIIKVYNSAPSQYRCELKCKKCGHVKDVRHHGALANPGCPVCGKKKEGFEEFYEKSKAREVNYVVREEPTSPSGIYKITIADKVYIGSSRNLKARINAHVTSMNTGRSNPLILKALDECNEVKIEIVEYCSPDDVVVREQYWIDELKPELNIAGTAANGVRSPMSMLMNSRDITGITLTKEDEETIKVVQELVKTREATVVAEIVGCSVHKVRSIASASLGRGEWAKYYVPLDYARVMATKGSYMSYNEIRDILILMIQGHSDMQISDMVKRDRDAIGNIRNRSVSHIVNLYEQDEAIRKLYDVIEINYNRKVEDGI